MTVTRRSASHGPSSTPERTSARGAGTSAAPLAHASHISSQLASNATDRPASTRSSGSTCHSVRLAVDERDRGAVGDGDALRRAGRARGEDDPGVVVGTGAAGTAGGLAEPCQLELVADRGADAGVGEDLLGARGGVVGVHRHVGGAGGEHAEDRDVELGGAAGDADADAVARPDAAGAQALGERSASVASAS